jgi:fructose-1,6-bisphosphatase/inositol monophosphatase family enzyme
VPATLDAVEAIVSRTEHDAGDLDRLGMPTGSARPVGSVAYKLLRVAAGADVLTYSVRPKAEWDVCGGIGLVLAAGRVYLRLDGQPSRSTSPCRGSRRAAWPAPSPGGGAAPALARCARGVSRTRVELGPAPKA